MTDTEKLETLQGEVAEIKLREALEQAGLDRTTAKTLAVGITCNDGNLMKMGMDAWVDREWQARKAELERQEQKKRDQKPDQGQQALEREVAKSMGLSDTETDDDFLKGFNSSFYGPPDRTRGPQRPV